MRCLKCRNKEFCADALQEPRLVGCSSGIPKYLPEKVAKQFYGQIEDASKSLGISKAQYYNCILVEMQKIMERRERSE